MILKDFIVGSKSMERLEIWEKMCMKRYEGFEHKKGFALDFFRKQGWIIKMDNGFGDKLWYPNLEIPIVKKMIVFFDECYKLKIEEMGD